MKKQIAQTHNWLKTLIIHYDICPFARKVAENNTLHYCVDEAIVIEENLETLISEARRLDDNSNIETSLLIYANAFADFDDFLDYLALADDLLALQGYEGIYQLASFHPHYCFADADETDPANYTNRSPYPMLHLIREASIDQVLQNYPNPEQIPVRNIKLTQELGLTKMQALLAAAMQ